MNEPRVGASVVVMTDVITFRVLSATSNGRLSVIELYAPPGGGPPPLHSHPPDEVFAVLEGSIALFTGDPLKPDRTDLAAGETAHVPGGTAHTFRNFGPGHARLLLIFSPGDMMEKFFVRAGIPVADLHDLPAVDLGTEVTRVFRVGAELGMQQFDPAYA